MTIYATETPFKCTITGKGIEDFLGDMAEDYGMVYSASSRCWLGDEGDIHSLVDALEGIDGIHITCERG